MVLIDTWRKEEGSVAFAENTNWGLGRLLRFAFESGQGKAQTKVGYQIIDPVEGNALIAIDDWPYEHTDQPITTTMGVNMSARCLLFWSTRHDTSHVDCSVYTLV